MIEFFKHSVLNKITPRGHGGLLATKEKKFFFSGFAGHRYLHLHRSGSRAVMVMNTLGERWVCKVRPIVFIEPRCTF